MYLGSLESTQEALASSNSYTSRAAASNRQTEAYLLCFGCV